LAREPGLTALGSGAAAGVDAGASTLDSTGAGAEAAVGNATDATGAGAKAADGTGAMAGRAADATCADDGAVDGKAAEGVGTVVAATDWVCVAAEIGSAPCKGRLHRPTRPMRVLCFIIGISCCPLYRQPGPSP